MDLRQQSLDQMDIQHICFLEKKSCLELKGMINIKGCLIVDSKGCFY